MKTVFPVLPVFLHPSHKQDDKFSHMVNHKHHPSPVCSAALEEGFVLHIHHSGKALPMSVH